MTIAYLESEHPKHIFMGVRIFEMLTGGTMDTEFMEVCGYLLHESIRVLGNLRERLYCRLCEGSQQLECKAVYPQSKQADNPEKLPLRLPAAGG